MSGDSPLRAGPFGRRRPRLKSVRARIGDLRAADPGALRPAAVLALVRDVLLLLRDLALDPRVPPRAKAIAALAAVYVLSPVDLVPDTIAGLGQLDDLTVLAYAVGVLLEAAGGDLVRAAWRGTEEGLALVLTLAGVSE